MFEEFSKLFKICLENISKKQEDVFYQMKWISNFVDGKYTKITRESKLNQKFYKEKIKNNSNYDELKRTFSKIKLNEKMDNEYETLLEEFIETYLYLTQKIEFDEKQFFKSCKIIEKHISDKYFKKFYFFTPIYNFDTEFDKIEINEFKIEKILPNQFDRITSIDISNDTNEPFINFEHKQLKYVLTFSVEKSLTSTIDPKIISSDILSALRLTTEGLVYFGNFYGYHPLDWQGEYFPGGKELPKKTNLRYFLKKKHIDSLKEIYFSFKNLHQNFNEEKIRYLIYAIRRFDYSYNDNLIEDNITDLMISLETLVNSQPYEVRDKTSLRSAIILEDNDDEKISCKKFIQKCYDIRSEIVHGKNRTTKINENGTVLLDRQIKEKLENYTRNAIVKMMTFQIKFKTQDEVLNRIDRFILNRRENLLD